MRDGTDHVNEVRLRGRVAATPEARVLPSGDELVTLRLVVTRTAKSPRLKAAARPRAVVDTLDVGCWSAATRRSAIRYRAGDVIEVEGALRRRFFRAGGASASRYEVEARSLSRVKAR